jgi:uncharacterized membrane protein YoaK (UPF0700 family)
VTPLAPQARHARTKSAVALLLTLAAGIVDAVGYLTLFQFFVANMTVPLAIEEEKDEPER